MRLFCELQSWSSVSYRIHDVNHQTAASVDISGPVQSLFPRGVNGLADEQLRIRALARAEFLRAAIADFGDVEIPFLVDAHSVRIEQASRPVGQRAPRVEQMPIEIVLHDFRISV